MIPLLVSAAMAIPNGSAVSLDTLTVAEAVSLHGQLVRVTVTASQPPDTFAGWTFAGCEVGNVERSVQFLGKWNVSQGGG